jgi:hypothetical protein
MKSKPAKKKVSSERPKTYEKPLSLNMPFDEAIKRIIRVPPIKAKKK